MAKFIYFLCMLTSLACAVLALRSFFQSRLRLLFWTGVSFAGLSVSNLLLLLDRTVFLETADLLTIRLWVALIAMVALLYGLTQGEN